LQDYSFFQGASLKGDNGRLYFGGEKGFNSFYPSKINTTPPLIVINMMQISNKTVTPSSDNTPLQKGISLTESITLPYSQNDFSFEFTAIHFSRPEKNKYAYFLEGFDEDWIYDNRRFASYTNLDPGQYTFKIKAANADGVWSINPKILKITILPPWWQTTYAYISYGFVILLFLFGFDRFQRRRILNKEREKQKIQEAELRALAAEAQARLIEAENERKTKELEEARNLQLSMLPHVLPELPNLDIAVYMKTATEVGGDYYDFHVGLDGTLTVVIGDATGHGLNAGTIVTATKSLFSSHASNPDIVYTFSEISRCLKEMKFRLLSMCLQILKIRGNNMYLSAAGMPPVLIYRRSTNNVEELLIKGMPLGTPASFPYEVKTSTLNSGDTILLMSDGFPELFNESKEMYGYERIERKFLEIADLSPDNIIAELIKSGDKWSNGREQDDDISFVVIKVK
jgi:serine phosphatase RsbU (regulator of sigma subunit)